MPAPENRPSQKEISSSNHPFSGAMLVSGRVNLPVTGKGFCASQDILACHLHGSFFMRKLSVISGKHLVLVSCNYFDIMLMSCNSLTTATCSNKTRIHHSKAT